MSKPPHETARETASDRRRALPQVEAVEVVAGGRRVLVEALLFVRAGVARCAAGVPAAVRAVVDAVRAVRRSATSAASFLTRLRSFFSALLVLAIRSFSTTLARTRAWWGRSPIVNHVITPGSL